MVVCYFREGPFCILKRGLGFSPALTRDPGATAAPRGLGQAWATPQRWADVFPAPGSSGPESPPWSPLCCPSGHLVLGVEVPPQPRRDTCPLPPRAAEPDQVQALGSVVLLAMGLLVTCTLRLTFRLRTFLPDDVAGAVSPHLRRDPSCEAERLPHERTDTWRQQRFQQGREEAVMLPADTSVWPGQRMKPTVPALRTQLELMARTTARPVLGRVGCCPWCLCTDLESLPPGQRCLRGRSGHC